MYLRLKLVLVSVLFHLECERKQGKQQGRKKTERKHKVRGTLLHSPCSHLTFKRWRGLIHDPSLLQLFSFTRAGPVGVRVVKMLESCFMEICFLT